MAINFNVDPYYDDFDSSKGFHRILFKPGVAVQARELTQLQTIINNQIKEFGNNIFADGALIIPGSKFFEKSYRSLKLQQTYNAVDADTILANLVNLELTGQTSGVKAIVTNYSLSEAGDPPTLYIKYTSGSSDASTFVFADDEVLTNSVNAIEVKTALVDCNNKGSAYHIESGVIYTKGHFVHFTDQTAVISKYTEVTDAIIGFDVNESILSSTDDSTLLDPANGSFNFTAPGADRYVIDLTLNSRPFTPTVEDDPNFVEIARIQNGVLISEKDASQYAVLADVMARRTFDESGDYVVREYEGYLKNHLRTLDGDVDGVYYAADGGDDGKMVLQMSQGKAYVKGYEIENLISSTLICEKARDFNSVTLSTVALPFGNYVVVDNINNIPQLGNLPVVDLYNQYNDTAGAENGTKVGTARIRHIEHQEGTVGTATAKYRVYLFAITMEDGYSFTNDVKQLNVTDATSDFTADVVPTTNLLSGAVSTTAASGALVGSGTRFTSQLNVDDYIQIGTNRYRITAIADDLNATISPVGVETISGSTFSLLTSTINDSDKNTAIFKMPVNVVKTVDPTGVSTTYSARRTYDQTLSSGIVTLTSGSNEIFSSFSADNYQLVITSGVDAGKFINLDGKVTRGGAPTGKTVTFDISGDGYTTETVRIVTTLQKTSSAADKKVKTLVENSTLDVTAEAAALAPVISLGKADGYRIKSITMGVDGAFGSPYDATTEVDITSRYTFDNGQKATYYGIASVKLKAGAEKPTSPIRITFDYFTHGGGDYFSVDSYTDIAYDDIPVVTLNNVQYTLRDCLDFRPRISDDGTGFTGAGSSVTEMPDFENDLITSYDYYLPRIDKAVLTRRGEFKYIKGNSSLDPQEPRTPSDSMALYVFKQKPYVFDILKDIEMIAVDNKRYTMRDIGKIEDRIANVEYYTSLSLLELEAETFQVKDENGFDRFKNGFVVDSFKGHGIGDPFNVDYGVAIDMDKFELRPLTDSDLFKITEVAADNTARSTAGYSLVGDLLTILPSSEEKFIENDKSSKSVNLNPFNVISWNGTITIDPPNDIWYEKTRVPDFKTNVEGNYDTLVADAKAKGTWGTVYGSWNTYRSSGYLRYQNRTKTTYNVVEVIDKSINRDVIVDSEVIPKMRSTTINMLIEGMKPNAKLYFYMDDVYVTNDCTLVGDGPAVTYASGDWPDTLPPGLIYTDNTGKATVQFNYSAEKYNLNTGPHMFYVSDSSVLDVENQETFAEAPFESMGYDQKIADEYVSTRNARLESNTTIQKRVRDVSPPPPPPPPRPAVNVKHYGTLNGLYNWAFGREIDSSGARYWGAKVSPATFTNALNNPTSTSRKGMEAVIQSVIYTGMTNGRESSSSMDYHIAKAGGNKVAAAKEMAAVAVKAVLDPSTAAPQWQQTATNARQAWIGTDFV